MHDFGEFCYLDVEKTGSHFISSFLTRHVSIPEVRFGKHERLWKLELFGNPDKLFFISARDPVEQMISLYYYSATKQGASYLHLAAWHVDCDTLYNGTMEGFCRWVEFLYNPKLALVLEENYYQSPKSRGQYLYGLMTHRFLMLSFYLPTRAVSTVRTKDQLRQLYARKKIHSDIIRTESLNEDLSRLIEKKLFPYFRNPSEAVAILREGGILNATPRKGEINSSSIPSHIVALIREKEWFMLEVLEQAKSAD